MTFIKPIAVIFYQSQFSLEKNSYGEGVDYIFIQVSSVLFTPLTVAPADY